MVGTLFRGCRCDRSCCNLDLSFNLVIVTMSFKILSSSTSLLSDHDPIARPCSDN